MDIDTAVRITKAVQITATVTMTAAVVYAHKKAHDINVAIADGEQQIRFGQARMRHIAETLGR